MKQEEKIVLGIVLYVLTALMSPSAGASEVSITSEDFQEMLKDCDKTNDMLKKGEYELDYLECLTLKHGVSEKVAEQMLK